MGEIHTDALETNLRNLNSCVFTAEERTKLSNMLAEDVWARLGAANRQEIQAWNQVQSKADWERFRDIRIKALRKSLGEFPPKPKDFHVQVTGTLKGVGFCIENLIFESQPGLLVTANLYLPDPLRLKMPGILLCHSHHNPKHQDELQDMGMTWARQGAMVLVIDQIGHGERRQHPFGAITRVMYQISEDYYSRYFLGMQLHLVGESLISWMAHDLMCGVDLLLNRPGIDPKKIILIGSVAGGGDPTAVTATFDPRITCTIPFNFGAAYKVPERFLHAFNENLKGEDTVFNFAGYGGDWESTRCLHLSARDGFFPWVIIGAVAPRYLIYAHEFFFNIERDPVWKHLQKIFNFYNNPTNLEFTPGGAECNNVGPLHRKQIYPILYRWFGIEIPEKEGPIHRQQMNQILWRWFGIPAEREYQERHSPEELRCFTEEANLKFQPKMVHKLMAEKGVELTGKARAKLEQLSSSDRRVKLRHDWTKLLGDVEAKSDLKAKLCSNWHLENITLEKVALEVEKGIIIPILQLSPTQHNIQGEKTPVVVAVSQEGKERFIKDYANEMAKLLHSNVAVCLPDLRGTGETRVNNASGRNSEETDISSIELMLGQTMLGARLRDLRSVLRYIRERPNIDQTHIALWGDSFAPNNPPSFSDLPQSSDKLLQQSEPLGSLLALFGALFEDDVRAAVARRGLVGFASLLSSPFCYTPHSVVIPNALSAGDLCDVAAALAPVPLRLEGMVDGRNCVVSDPELNKWFKPTLNSYATHPNRLHISSAITDNLAAWLIKTLKQR